MNYPKHIPNSDYLGSPLLWWKCQCFKKNYPTPVQTSSNTTAWTLDKYGTNAHDAFFYVEVRRTQSVKTRHKKNISQLSLFTIQEMHPPRPWSKKMNRRQKAGNMFFSATTFHQNPANERKKISKRKWKLQPLKDLFSIYE